jgi:hypothetical protein
MTASGETGCIEPPGAVVPGRGQLTAQQSRAAEASGTLPSCARAAAQQSMLLVPLILHSCSSECSGIPASTLPVMTVKRKRAVSHFAIGSGNYIQRINCTSRHYLTVRLKEYISSLCS